MLTKRSENLCNVYVMPLLNLTRSSFGDRTNFVNSYISSDCRHLLIHVRQLYSHSMQHPLFVCDIVVDGKTYLVYSIPAEYYTTVDKFLKGQYSQFDPNVKHIIKTRSGLKYKVPVGRDKTSSARELLALDKDPGLKKVIEQELDVKLDDKAELISIPDEHNFFDFSLESALTES